MSTQSVPPTFKAWQFNSARGGLEKNLALNPSAPEIKQRAKQHLVQVIAVSLNPVDHKIVEIPFVLSLLNTPATPGFDFAGRIVQPADGSSLQPGQYVFGSAAAPPIGGALAEYAAVDAKATALLPEGVSPIHGASVPIAGVSAYQSIVPFIKEGSNVFINGGSGGTGTFGIQIAKAMGCHVTTSCSTPNVQLCKELGADEVIDYKKGSVLQACPSI
jgi:NADPH:quinone reductase-like Zn-dependent oxidoreductase